MNASRLVRVQMTIYCPNCRYVGCQYTITPRDGGMAHYRVYCPYCGHTSEASAPIYPRR